MSDIDVARALAEVWSDLRRNDGRGACIESTRIALDVLSVFGVKAKPLPCGLWVGNIEALGLTIQGVPYQEWPPSAWSVGVAPDGQVGNRSYSGHLMVEHDEWLADYDLGLFSRPQRGWTTQPSVFPKITDQAEADRDLALLQYDEYRIVTSGDACIIVTPRPELRRWKTGNAWRSTFFGPAVDTLVRLTRERLESNVRERKR